MTKIIFYFILILYFYRMIDTNKLSEIELDGIDTSDYPKFCDAFLTFAVYNDEGFRRPLTDEEIDEVNDTESEFIHEQVLKQIF